MKKIIFLLLLLVGYPCFLRAQTEPNFQITGVLFDLAENETVPYATIKVVTKKEPAKSVTMLAADDRGAFIIKLKEADTYLVEFHSVGKKTVKKEVTLTISNPHAALGQLDMPNDAKHLDEVTVVAQKQLVKVEIDKLTYSVEDDPESKTSTTLEMFRKIPMLTLDGEDKIQLKGKSNFKILVNGKPSNMLSNNPSEVLKSMPANSVKSVEVITDPGAKYDAEGVDGIINIITSRSALDGYTGTIRASASTPESFGGGGYLSFKTGKFGFTGNYNYNLYRSPTTEGYFMRQSYTDATNHILEQKSENRNRSRNQYGSFEASYEIDSLNLLSAGFSYFGGKSTSKSATHVDMYNEMREAVYQYTQVGENERDYGGMNFNIDYQRSTKRPNELLTLSYRFSHDPNNSSGFTDINPTLNYEPRRQNNRNEAGTTEHTGQIDYALPLGKEHNLEVGMKYINRASRSETTVYLYDYETGEWNPSFGNGDHFNHIQHIYSGYTGYAYKHKKIGAKAGLRFEGTSVEVKYPDKPTQDFDASYFDVVPSVSTNYMLAASQNLTAGYNMRISRPGIWSLNPYVNDTDPRNISFGNPNLDSEKSHRFNLGYSNYSGKYSINTSLSYSFVNNGIERYTYVEDGIAYSTYDNIGKRQDVSLNLYANWNATSKMRVMMNAYGSYVDLKANNESGLANSGVTGGLYGNIQYTFPLNIRFNMGGGLYAPWIMLQGEGNTQHFYNFSVSKDFLKSKKLSVSINASNPFKKLMAYDTTLSDENFYQHSRGNFVARRFSISASFRFGELKEQIKKARRGITNDDAQQQSSGGRSE
ncbi:MAG: TonB-dependent receptor domain-containing protein [Phocaeicola sp.]